MHVSCLKRTKKGETKNRVTKMSTRGAEAILFGPFGCVPPANPRVCNSSSLKKDSLLASSARLARAVAQLILYRAFSHLIIPILSPHNGTFSTCLILDRLSAVRHDCWPLQTPDSVARSLIAGAADQISQVRTNSIAILSLTPTPPSFTARLKPRSTHSFWTKLKVYATDSAIG